MVQHEGKHCGLGGGQEPTFWKECKQLAVGASPRRPLPRVLEPGGALGATGLKMAGLGQGSEEVGTSLS